MEPHALCAALGSLAAGRSLSADESREAIGAILDGPLPEGAVGALLTALALRGETADELLGAVEAVRARMIAFDTGEPGREYLDTCGTGGDSAGTMNVSTAAAIVAAACGVRVAKHGNRAASGTSGSSDVLTELGVGVDSRPEVLRRCLTEVGIAFLFAPSFHPGLRGVARVRRQLPFRTIFNLAGPLCNPARPTHQLLGVPRIELARTMAQVLARTPALRRAVVVCGGDGLDEVTLDGSTSVIVVDGGNTIEIEWTPEAFGLPRVPSTSLRVSGPRQSAELIRELLAGRPGPVRDVVLANAAAALWTVDPRPLSVAVEKAASAIDSGAGARLLERWSSLSGTRS